MPPNSSSQPRSYAAAHFALELDNKTDVGLFRSIEGGGVKADVMTHQTGANYDRWHQLGKPKFEDIKFQVGMSMSKPFYDWIDAFVRGEALRKDGAIVAADFYFNERARREFTNAMIKELTFPKLDGQDKGAAYMSIAVAVEEIAFKKGGGQKIQQSFGMNAQKLWTACNFRFVMDGFEQACKRTTKVDSFTIKQNIIEHHVGGRRAPMKCPSQVEFPQISFYVPESDAQPFFNHFTDYGINGKQRDHGKRSGQLQTYDNDGRALFTLEFYEADILAVTPDKADAGSEEIKLVKIDIFTEKMTFAYAAMQVE